MKLRAFDCHITITPTNGHSTLPAGLWVDVTTDGIHLNVGTLGSEGVDEGEGEVFQDVSITPEGVGEGNPNEGWSGSITLFLSSYGEHHLETLWLEHLTLTHPTVTATLVYVDPDSDTAGERVIEGGLTLQSVEEESVSYEWYSRIGRTHEDYTADVLRKRVS